jgi:biotin carboxyl carrier protein
MAKTYIVTVNGVNYEVVVEEGAAGAVAAPAAAPAAPAAPAAAPVAGGTKVTSPLPGTLLRIIAKNGTAVKKGDLLCIVEAMKMENEIFAPADGVVNAVPSEGASLNSGDVIMTIA